MSDLGNLSHCMIDSDSAARNRARGLRRRAVAAAIATELMLVGALLLCPLIAPGALPALFIVTPARIYQSARPVTRLRVVQSRGREVTAPMPITPPLYQPPVIPPHVNSVPGEAPNVDQPTVPTDSGNAIGWNGRDAIAIAPPREAAEKNKPLKQSEGVMEARLTRRIRPDYPKIAELMHLSGTVQLHAIIGTDGSVRALEVLSGNQILAQAALAAVRQWRYEPTRLNGQRVEVETYITVKFQVD